MFKPKGAIIFSVFVVAMSVLFVPWSAAQNDGWRTIEFETTQVTQADVTLSPDGHWLVFTMLGHLFRLPVEGGTAEQLTFGPYYDTDALFSPDGTRVAFVSDRDGSEGNIFVLELATRQITQVTHETSAGRPTWTPDGQAIVYLRFILEESLYWHANLGPAPALVRRVSLSGGEPETLSAPEREFRSVFYLPDGRLAWTVVERKTRSLRPIIIHFLDTPVNTRIEVMSPQGIVSSLRTLAGIADRAVASSTGKSLYCRHYIPPAPYTFIQEDNLLFLPLSEGADRLIYPVSGMSGIRYWSPRFAMASDNKTLYVGNSGRLWKIAVPGRVPEPIAFRALVKLDIQEPTPPPEWTAPAAGTSAPPRSVLHPRLSPDGRMLVFGAAGYLWQQPLDGGPAVRLFEGKALESDPTFSPDGKQLAFLREEYGKENELRVFHFKTGQTRTLASSDSGFKQLSWSPDGQRLLFADGDTHIVKSVKISDGTTERIARTSGWEPYPQFSVDGRSIYFTANFEGMATLYRLSLKAKSEPEQMTQGVRYLNGVRLSPDGKWLAFRRKVDIWVVPLGKEPVKEEDIHQFSQEGGGSFAFTSDSSALIYSAGNLVWRHPLTGGEREEIPIRLELPRPTPPPLLLRRVRVLDFDTGVFGSETSLYIEQGRIREIGARDVRKLRRETVILDAGGRFAIPGLFDVHVRGGSPSVYLAYGVTSVCNTRGVLAWHNALADRSEATSEPIPRYFYSGDMFVSTFPHAGDRRRVLIDNEEEARNYVRRWKERGAHFIMTYPPIAWPVARAVAEEAHRVGLPVIGHGITPEEVTKSVTLGYAGVFHARNRFYDDVLEMLAAAGTRWDTFTTTGGTTLQLRDEPERLADEKFCAFTPEKRIHRGLASNPFKVLSDTALRGRLVELLACIRAAHRSGVRLLVGTDAPVDELFHGSSLHWDLEYFVQAGLAPFEVLRIATQQAAEAVGAENDLGTIEPGKLADIVLLDANPLEDIKNTQSIWRVIKGGWVFDPEELKPEVAESSKK